MVFLVGGNLPAIGRVRLADIAYVNVGLLFIGLVELLDLTDRAAERRSGARPEDEYYRLAFKVRQDDWIFPVDIADLKRRNGVADLERSLARSQLGFGQARGIFGFIESWRLS